MIQKQKVYIPVDANEELPSIGHEYFIQYNENEKEVGDVSSINALIENGWLDVRFLKPQEIYTFTKEQLEELLDKSYRQGHFDHSTFRFVSNKQEYPSYNNVHEYIQSLNLK